MFKLNCKIFFVFLMFILNGWYISAQGTINTPARECLGNITNFSYTPPAGLTLSSASWNFGDGYTSASLTPVHIYGNTGVYTIVIQATFTNSTTATDSTKIEVLGLPKIAFYYDLQSDSCYNHNKVCYIDTSRPAVPGQTITNRLFVWGDGSFDQVSSPAFGQKLCHTYAVTDLYNLRMELTDKFGCKSSLAANINIVENIDADFDLKAEFYNCTQFRVCVINKSVGGNPKTEHYKWYIDTSKLDTLPYFSSSKCIYYDKTRSSSVTLIANANNNCIDTVTKPFNFYIDQLPDSLYMSDSVWCYADITAHAAWIKNVARDTTQWYLDGFFNPLVRGAELTIWTDPIPPGKHNLKVEIMRGFAACPLNIDFRILGPAANFRVFDNGQCLSSNEVFFLDNSFGINRNNCLFRWAIQDPNGDPCVNNRLNDINKNKNCNTSLDWFTRHRFKRRLWTQYPVKLWVKDTLTGCEDSTDRTIFMDNCCSLLFLDSVNVCRDGFFYNDVGGPPPYEFTLDSANQKWIRFAGHIDSSLSGIFDVGLRFRSQISPWAEKFGDDSIKIHSDTLTYYDTVYFKDYMHIKEQKTDSIYLNVYGGCKPPYKVSLHFKNGMFYPGDSLFVTWGGSGDSADFAKKFTQTTKIDSLFQTFKFTGLLTEIRVMMENQYGCRTNTSISLKKGKLLSKDYLRNRCLGDVTCFTPYVYDVKSSGFWTGNTAYDNVSWWFDDTGLVNQFNPCYQFKSGGKHIIQMLVKDSLGCRDTLTDSIFVQDLRANITYNSRYMYCSELKQFFDSSSFIPNRGDSILKFVWQFGSGVYSSFQKNPLQSIITSLDKIPAAIVVGTKYGCYDTMHFEINVIGPKPYFIIKDTIGCGSLNALFTNLSKNCKQYIWQYGDSLQTTFQTSNKQAVNFLYNKPGRYFISLVGIDTVFNPFTNKLEYCSSTFPDKLFQKDTSRTVLVLPLNKTGIISKDTVCLGSIINFFSKSDTAYDYDYWQMGDTSAAFKLNAGSTHTYQYKQTGSYNVRLSPGYNTAINNQCRDSAQKNILVLGVKANFDIDPLNVPPVFLFHNKSNPANASLRWDFGQPSGSANTSTDQDPSHDYGMDTGTFTVCLIAALPEGCSDTICKTVFNDHKESFGIYNVFTPGNIDGKNDQYDIQIENEDLYDLQIYDRWGNLVYEGKEDADNTQNINWNGKVMNKGAECPAATYYYIFRYSLKQKPGEVITLNGVIMLIR